MLHTTYDIELRIARIATMSRRAARPVALPRRRRHAKSPGEKIENRGRPFAFSSGFTINASRLFVKGQCTRVSANEGARHGAPDAPTIYDQRAASRRGQASIPYHSHRQLMPGVAPSSRSVRASVRSATRRGRFASLGEAENHSVGGTKHQTQQNTCSENTFPSAVASCRRPCSMRAHATCRVWVRVR